MIDSPLNTTTPATPDDDTGAAPLPTVASEIRSGRPPELGGLIRSLRGRWTVKLLESEDRLAGVWLVGVRPGRRRSA